MAEDLRARQHLGQRLRAMRETAGFTLTVAAGHLHLPADMLDQIERGQHAVPPPLAQSMTQMYGHPDSDILIMARLARHRGQSADAAAWHRDQLAWESTATRICEVAVTHLPELLHTSDYARAVFLSAPSGWTCHGHVAEHSIRAGLTALALRQRRLAGPPLLPMQVVITEQALRAQVAAPPMMATQWAHLTTVTMRYAVTVRVLPDAHHGLVGGQHGWRLVEFAHLPEPRWLFRRSGHATTSTEHEQQVALAYRKFLRLSAASLSPQDSQALIQQLIHHATHGRK